MHATRSTAIHLEEAVSLRDLRIAHLQNPSHFHAIPRSNRRTYHLSSSDSTTLTSTPLSRVESDLLATNYRLGLLDYLLSLGENQFDVAGVGHVWIDLALHVSRSSSARRLS